MDVGRYLHGCKNGGYIHIIPYMGISIVMGVPLYRWLKKVEHPTKMDDLEVPLI